jgi:hypothetical protein
MQFYRDASGGSFLEVSAKPCGNKLLGLPSLWKWI